LKPLKRNIRIDCGKYLVRTMKADDATDRLSSWLADPGATDTLNLRAARASQSELAAYIRSFDQWSRWLLGVFDKKTGTQIGIIRTDIDYAASRCHVNMLIGEAAYRNAGVTADVLIAGLDYVFETVGLSKMTASALARNHLTIDYLLKAGWQLDNAAAHRIRSNADGSMLDLSSLSLTRDAWRAWKGTKTGDRLLRRVSASRRPNR
jgi:RimJ/RimL family protein N-acetyltransferase